ncbi:hypothetical protein D3C81_2258000 [compost metagenome]
MGGANIELVGQDTAVLSIGELNQTCGVGHVFIGEVKSDAFTFQRIERGQAGCKIALQRNLLQ